MDSFLSSPLARAVGRSSRRAAPASLQARFSLQTLEDRSLMSSSVQLSGLGWKPIGPGLILNSSAAVPTLTVAGRVNSIAHAPVPFDPLNPSFTGPTDPNDPRFADFNTYYAGLPGGGIARTTDGGQNWRFLTDNLPTSSWAGDDINRNLHVGAVAVSPLDRNLVIAGTGEVGDFVFGYAGSGILLSRDGGETWTLNKGPNNEFSGNAFNKFVFHPTDPNVIYAVANNNLVRYESPVQSQLYRTLDGGVNWESVTVNSGAPFNAVTDFVLNPVTPNVGYVGIQSYGVIRTQNLQTGTFGQPGYSPTPAANVTYSLTLGGTGTQLGGGTFGQIRLAFGLGTPDQPSRVYALTTAGSPQTATQLFRSDDSGINYRRLDPFPGAQFSTATPVNIDLGTYALELVADPTTPNRIYIGGQGRGSIQVLTNADYNPDVPTQLPNYINLTIPPGVGDAYINVRNLVFDDTGAKDIDGRRLTPGRMLLATDSGVYRFEAPGGAVTTNDNFLTNNLTFTSLNGKVGTTSLNAHQVFATGLPPRDDNRFIQGTYVNGTPIFQDNGPLSPTDPNYATLFGQQLIGGAETRGNGGETLFNPLDPLSVFRVTNRSDYAEFGFRDVETTKGALFQRSIDGGQTFTTSVGGIISPDRVATSVALHIDPSPTPGTKDARLYLGTDVVNISSNDGRSWSQYGPNLPFVTDALLVNYARRPRITAISNSRAGGPIYAAVDYRTNGTVADGAALYRWFPGSPAWSNVSPGTTDFLLPPTPGAPGFPVPNDFSIDSNPFDLFTGDITDIVVDPTNFNIVYIVRDSTGIGTTGERRVYRTINGGFSWTDIGINLPATTATSDGLRIYSIALDPNRFNIDPNDPNNTVNQTDDDLYVGTSTGVWKLTNPVTSTTWTRVGGTGGGYDSTGTDLVAGALPDVMVRDVKLNTTTGVLAASTFGRGVWQIQIRPYIRGLVYDDATGNGTFDAAPTVPADTILSGVVVVANDIVPNPPVQFANATSASNGEYVFRSLPASDYSFIPANASTKLIDSASLYYFTSAPIVRTLTATSTINGQDLFVFKRVAINGKVYEDANGNAALDGNENPGVGYRVELYAPAGTLAANKTLVAFTTTDALGNYVFLGVGPLRTAAVGPATPFSSGYQVVLSKATYQMTETPIPTGVLRGGLDLTDAANQNLTRIGAFRLGQIGGQVFGDTNGDGALNNGETGLAGFTVNIFDAANGLVASAASAADGSYLFGDFVNTLRAGSYTVQVVDKTGFVRTTPQFGPLLIQSGTKTLGINVGEFAAASIFGNAFEDLNGNGLRDGLDGRPFVVTVSLIDRRTGAAVRSTQTDGAGNYVFNDLFPLDLNGNNAPYLVRLTSPTEVFAQTIVDPSIRLAAGSSNRADLPLFVRTSVTGFAFEDFNGNGFRDAGEGGLVGGSVSLLNSATGAVVLTTSTDGAGNYTFTGVGPILGAVPYRVGANPAGFVQTTANPPDFTLTSGVPVTVPVAIGLFRLATFSGTIFDDSNGSGGLDAGEVGAPGRTVQLINADTLAVAATTTTDANGAYVLTAGVGRFFVQVPAVAGFVQTTPSRPAVATTSGLATTGLDFGLFRLTAATGVVYDDLNGDGVRDAEPGLSGVAVELVSVATNAVVGTAVTDATGFFAIQGVGPGNFIVRVTLRPGYVASTPVTQAFTATSGTPSTFAFGSFLPTTISGNVYEDLDRSNVNNAGDIPSAGWTVQLTRAGGIVVGSALSDARGAFSFASLPPGVYTARVLNRQGFTILNNGSQTVTVTSGTPVTLAQVGVLKLGSLSGTVFLDTNRNGRRDSFERGLVGGVVQALNSSGVEVAQATTDSNGLYTFLNLQSGTYTVRLLAAPPGFALAPSGATSLTATTAVGSVSPNNAVTGLNFGLIGRRRYALAADGGGGPRVQVYDALSNTLLQDFFVYETTFTGGVRVAEGDVNGDGIDDLVVAPGKGGGPRIRVISGADGVTELYNYFAYEPTFTDGLYVTAADVDGDGFADIITGTDAGGGPRVTVFGGKQGVVIADFFAYDDTFRGGVRVGAGDLDGDGIAEILTAMGIGGSPLVKSFGGGNFRELASFNAFDEGYTGGLFLANSTVDPSTGRADIVLGSGVAFPTTPTVRVFDGLNFSQKAEIEAFPSGGAIDGYAGEVRVSSFDRNGDNVPDIGIASGAGSSSRLRFVDGTNFRQIGEEVQPYESSFFGGIFIG